jgi:hypothetical protein
MKVIIILLFLIPFLIYSESNDTKDSKINDASSKQQDEIRKRKLIYSLGISNRVEKIPSLKLDYNLTSKFSIGYSHFYKMYEKKEPFLIFPLDVSISSSGISNNSKTNNTTYLNIEEVTTKNIGLLNFKYYLFSKIPIFLTCGLGREFSSNKSVYNTYGEINPDRSFNFKPTIQFKNYIPPHFLSFYGLGFQWMFQNGITVGYEILFLRTLNRKIESETLNLNVTTLNEIIIMKAIDNSLNGVQNISEVIRNLWLGYSYEF